MTTNYKILGQAAPAAATNTTLYTVPANTQTVVSTLSIANVSLLDGFNVAVVPFGQVLSAKHYINFQNYVNTGDSIFLTLGLTLSAGDTIQVKSNLGNIAFGLFGSETA